MRERRRGRRERRAWRDDGAEIRAQEFASYRRMTAGANLQAAAVGKRVAAVADRGLFAGARQRVREELVVVDASGREPERAVEQHGARRKTGPAASRDEITRRDRLRDRE